ncbi:hypothetical protein AWZ03_013737 [Drosophila navojoa]|uniref:Uncharacterized protein n=1 Tax=Drosophila navojoa TaxID=7232 RepID=A0A484AW47_DRONA|nr:hypothetical protein AWZ03_013737 [Drosophila navojoa]
MLREGPIITFIRTAIDLLGHINNMALIGCHATPSDDSQISCMTDGRPSRQQAPGNGPRAANRQQSTVNGQQSCCRRDSCTFMLASPQGSAEMRAGTAAAPQLMERRNTEIQLLEYIMAPPAKKMQLSDGTATPTPSTAGQSAGVSRRRSAGRLTKSQSDSLCRPAVRLSGLALGLFVDLDVNPDGNPGHPG